LLCAGRIFGVLTERVEAPDLMVESLSSIGSGVGLTAGGRFMVPPRGRGHSERCSPPNHPPYSVNSMVAEIRNLADGEDLAFGRIGDSPTRSPSRQKIPVLPRPTPGPQRAHRHDPTRLLRIQSPPMADFDIIPRSAVRDDLQICLRRRWQNPQSCCRPARRQPAIAVVCPFPTMFHRAQKGSGTWETPADSVCVGS
jgi:hypothetical protein